MSEKRYLDADALYEMARTNPNYKDFGRSQADLTSLRELLDEYPAADVEPVVRGEWQEFDTDMNAYSCSSCNEPQMFIEGNPEQNQYSFCPHCGAHMERSGSGEN